MIGVILISGLGHSATGEGCGMQRLAERLRRIVGVKVARFTWRDVADAVTWAEMFDHPIFVGHSFGGDAAVECARRLNDPCRLVAVDPVPRSAWERWTKSRIDLSPNVTRALRIRRERGIYPLSKSLRGVNVEVVTIPGTGHDSVMRSFRTHELIAAFVAGE